VNILEKKQSEFPASNILPDFWLCH